MKLHATKGVVLRAVKYGETSLIVSVYTELFGIQSYIINGIRTTSKKGSSKTSYFQPGALLELIVYHNEFKNLQRIKEYKWAHLFQHIFFDVIKNSVAVFMIELLQKTIKEPEANADLFYFIEDALIHLDSADPVVTANFPLYFASHLTSFFGFRISDEYNEEHSFLDLQEGSFVREQPLHPHWIGDPYAQFASQFMKTMQPDELKQIRINHEKRRILMNAYQIFYSLHVPDFGTMKTLAVLQEVI